MVPPSRPGSRRSGRGGCGGGVGVVVIVFLSNVPGTGLVTNSTLFGYLMVHVFRTVPIGSHLTLSLYRSSLRSAV